MQLNIGNQMDSFKYLSSLRAEILEVVTGVENSGWSLFWDNTTPNWSTKMKLEKLYARYLNEAAKFGLYIVTRHCDCPNPRHTDYPTSNSYGLDIYYRDESYIWNGGQIYQGKRHCTCPCSPKNKPSEHWVIDDVVYHKDSVIDFCTKLEDILEDIYESIECADDKKPRSAIRENLLRAVLRINDQLLPEPMDSYIENTLEKNT